MGRTSHMRRLVPIQACRSNSFELRTGTSAGSGSTAGPRKGTANLLYRVPIRHHPYFNIFLSTCPKYQADAPDPLPYCTKTGSPCETSANSAAVRVKVTVVVSPETG